MLVSFQSKKILDNRGWFSETYRIDKILEHTQNEEFIQDNQSLTFNIGTIRGLHFQVPPHQQAKLVRCLSGSIFDVAVDIRCGSPTFGKWIGLELSSENAKQLYIPAGFAHGFMTLEPNSAVLYKVSKYYAPECDRGIAWNDKDIGIDWPIQKNKPDLSLKDSKFPFLKDFVSPFVYIGKPMSLTEVIL